MKYFGPDLFSAHRPQRTVLKFSGGAGSRAAGRKWIDEGGASLELLFTDTLTEDQDTYRFLIAGAANLLGIQLPSGFIPTVDDFPAWEGDGTDRSDYKRYVLALRARACAALPGLIWLSDGRDVFDVFDQENFLGNPRFDPCSKILKRRTSDRFLESEFDRARTTVLIGFGPDEPERMFGNPKYGTRGLQVIMAEQGWRFEAPLIGEPGWWPHRVEEEVARAGLFEQRLYRLGYAHANCGGGCCKAGMGHWRDTLQFFPLRYLFWETFEQRIRGRLGDVAMLTTKKKGEDRKTLTLAELRIRNLTFVERADKGACRCATGDDPNMQGIAA